MIHVGVSGLANKITLEKLARKSGYNRTDVNGQLPPGGECCIGCEDQVCVSLDLDSICSQVNNSKLGSISCVSSNAGRYELLVWLFTIECFSLKITNVNLKHVS